MAANYNYIYNDIYNYTYVKDCKNEDFNSLMVESRLNIFHSKFNWRIFCDTDSWISCLKIKQILQIIITITSLNITPS